MDNTHTVAEILRLPLHCCRRLSPDRVVCIVTEEWMKQLYQGRVQPLQADPNFYAFTAEKYLAHSCPSPPSPWIRLTVKTWPKSQQGIQSLLDSGLGAHTIGDSTVELMGSVSRDNLHNLWQAAQNRFIQAHTHSHNVQGQQQMRHSPGCSSRPQESLSDQMWHWIWRLSPDVHIHVGDNVSEGRKDETFGASSTTSSNLHNLLLQNKQKYPHIHSDEKDHMLHSVTRVRVLVETDTSFLLLQPYVEYSLQDVMSYSPAILDTCYSKPLFILYQVLQAMAVMHSRGLPLGCIGLDTVLLDTDMWVSVLCPQKRALTSLASSSVAPESNLAEEIHKTCNGVVQGNTDANKSGTSSCKMSEAGVSQTVVASQSVPLSLQSQESSRDPPAPTHMMRQLTSSYTDEDERLYLEGCQFLQQQGYVLLAQNSVTELVDAWVERRLSNFQYLLILNHLAGRRLNDPNNHPVLPWVMDFSHPHDGYRDLTKSKFRLNKGDRQLDFTFGFESSYTNTGADNQDPDNIPHHVSDVLSDITYYVYKARRMPKTILCGHVRTVWVPHEYPASMQRMQNWTPDECIPEFFTDPQLFQSIHSDLPDLEIPAWCSSTREFVIRHMATLESEKVSEQLHHWIDLTFGYKLSGKAAVSAKNVYLQLVDGHQALRGHGVMQLFMQPHPHRLPLSSRPHLGPLRSLRDVNTRMSEEEFKHDPKMFEVSFDNVTFQNTTPESAIISLPHNYDPLVELEHCEALQGFRNKSLLCLQKENSALSPQVDTKPRQHALVTKDMGSFLCLVCEMFLAPKLRMQEEAPSLVKRLQNIKFLCAGDTSMIPRPFQKAVRLLLNDLHVEESSDLSKGGVNTCKVHFSPVVTGGLPPPTPSLLLHPQADVLPFPAYFLSLYTCLCRLKATDEAMQEVKRGMESPAEKAAMLKQLARSKVPVMEQFLLKWGGILGKEGLQLVLPLVDSLLADKLTMVQAAWLLFNILSRALGPAHTSQTFLRALTILLSEGPATAKHIKLYHRTYLTQLLLRLHLQPFLHHFATLLVEAVAGYKDFLVPSRFYSQELLDDLDTAEQDGQWMTQLQSQEPGVDLAEEVREEGLVDEVDTAGAGGEVDKGVDDDDRGEFLDAMSMSDEAEAIGDVLEFAGKEESSSIGENNEDTVFESDRCSIHSISNILCRSGRRSTTVEEEEEEEDKVFDSPRNSEGGMSKPASTSSLGNMAGDGIDIPPTAVSEQSPGSAKGLILQASRQTSSGANSPSTVLDRSDNTQGQKVKASRPLYVSVGKAAADAESDEMNLKGDSDEGDGVGYSKPKVSDNMRRSETEDLMSTLSLNSPTSAINIRHIAGDSVKWLATKLGPVLAARYLSRNLIRMLPLCYLGESQLHAIATTESAVVKTSRCVVGDSNASKVLECIAFVASLYGENIILIQYLPSIVDLISVAQRRFTQRSESGLVAATILLRFVVPLLSDKTLMDILEVTIVSECVTPVLSMLTSTSVSFPSGAPCRSLLCHKLLDLLYVLGLRLGLEMTRRYLHNPMLVFMDAFSTVHAPDDAVASLSVSPVVSTANSDESYVTIKMDTTTHQYTIGTPVNPSLLGSTPGGYSLSPGANMSRWHSLAAMGTVDEREECVSPRPGQDTAEKCRLELAGVFTPELALAAYIPLCRIFGSIHMEESLTNDDLIRQLCAQQDSTTDQPPVTVAPTPVKPAEVVPETSPDTSVMGGLGSNVEVVGNRIQLANDQSDRPPSPSPSFTQFGRGYRHDGILHIVHDELRSHDMDASKRRHLHGNWLQYWEHELGLHERDTLFNFKQIKLQSFVGHSNSIRCIVPMDTENCFISASKDKTVRLWALTSCGDGISKVPCQWTYQQHKKSVFSVAYVESMRQVASCDSTVHVWDPYTGVGLCQLESTRYSPAVALQAIPAPSPLVLMGTTEATLRFLDLRTYKYGHEYRCSTGSLGLLRCVGVCPEGTWVAVGFSTGVISILELSSGLLLSSWKGHDGEILQLKAYSKHKLVSSSFDGTLKVWSVEGGEICPLKGPSDPVHCFSFYRDQVLSATTANRIGVHTSVSENAMFSSVKLRSDTFKGVLTSMAVVPLNRTLLLGSDNGTIQLLA